MSSSLLTVKLPYLLDESYAVDYFNYMIKSLNQELSGEKYSIVDINSGITSSFNKMVNSLNARNILNMNLQYINSDSDTLLAYNWAVKVINSSRK